MSSLFEPTVARANLFSTQSAYTKSTLSSAASSTAVGNTFDIASYLTANSAASTDNLAMQMDDFLKLMVAQFQNQDIDNTASTADMMNQIMQMSTIQAMTTMTNAMNMTYASALVGKTVTIADTSNGSGKTREIVGTVTGTGNYNGEQMVFVNGEQYKLSSVAVVGTLPNYEQPTTTDDGQTAESQQPTGEMQTL